MWPSLLHPALEGSAGEREKEIEKKAGCGVEEWGEEPLVHKHKSGHERLMPEERGGHGIFSLPPQVYSVKRDMALQLAPVW